MKFLGVGAILGLILLAILLGPLLGLWALNTLSEQAGLGWYIPHNVWTYLAMYALMGVFRGGSASVKS